MALVIFTGTYLTAAGIFWIVTALARGGLARIFKSVSAALLSPLGTIDEAVSDDWPRMAQQSASMKVAPRALSEALQLTVTLEPKSQGQITAQRQIVTALEEALDARRQRIIVSRSSVNWVKWACLLAQAVCTLATIAIVHHDSRGASVIAMGIFATGVAVSLLLIASHDRPFTGEISIKPDLLQEAMPDDAQHR